MDAPEKRLFTDLLKVSAVAAGIHWFVEVPLHEYGHYWVATALGLNAHIGGSDTVVDVASGTPPLYGTLFFLAGGLVSGTILSALYFVMREPYRKGLLPIIASEFVYAPFDATQLGYALGLAALLIVWSLIFGGFLARFLGGGKAESTANLGTRWTATPSPLRSILRSVRE